MNDKVFISDIELMNFGSIQNLSEKAESLLNHQKENWDLVKTNFIALDYVKTKKYDFDNFYINTQFNPSRIISSSAKVDKKSIENRACFLCEDNLPSVQRGINYKNKYSILCNPYPIFKQHLTIAHHEHTPQDIMNSFSDMLELTYDLRDNFFVFYNGPKCGASAPDHLHFQAGLRNSTPLEKFYPNLLKRKSEILLTNNQIKILNVRDEFLNFIYIKSDDTNSMEIAFSKILGQMKILHRLEDEPLLNILTFHDDDEWHVFIFPRKKHRPEQFFLENESRILISPASVDMAGLCITPRLEDFLKLSKDDISSIYSQVLMDDELTDSLSAIFKNSQ